MTWHRLGEFLLENKIAMGLLVTAGIATMPATSSTLSWRTLYTWIYEWAHLFLNLRRPTLPAETPANPKP